MGFLHPWFLLLGLGIAVPIIIHLFNFHRFKQVLFTNVKFLQAITAENKKQNKLLERLLLLLRCLVILFLALLFAQPYIKNSENQLVKEGNNAVVLIVDNSFSMQNVSSKGSLLENAKAKTLEILSQYSDNDVFCLLTMDLEGRHKHFVSKNTFSELLKDVEISPSSRPYSELVNTAHHLLSLRNENSKRVFLIGDFQTTSFDAEHIKQDSLVKDVFLPLEVNNINNVYVDSVFVDKDVFLIGQTVDLTVRIKNASNEDIEKQTVKLYINEKQQSLVTCDIKANASVEIPMSFVIDSTGHLDGRVNILDNPVTYDDDFYFSINVNAKISILSINGNGENQYLNRLFANSSEAELKNMNASNINFAELHSYDVIILNELKKITSGLANELKNLRESKKTLVVIPSENIDFTSYNSAMQTLQMPMYSSLFDKPSKVAKTDIDNRIFKDVFSQVTDNMEMPSCKKYYKLTSSANTSKQDIMTLTDNNTFICENTVDNSDAFIFTTPFNDNWTDLVNQSVFVPVMWNIVLYSSVLPPLFMFTNSKEPVDLSDYTYDEDAIELYYFGETTDFIQRGTQNEFKTRNMAKGYAYAVYLPDGIKEAGFYDIKDGQIEMRTLALNYPREESGLSFLNSSQINKQLKAVNYKNYSVFNDRKMITTYFAQSKKGFDFTFLLLTLIVLCIAGEELVLYKLKRHK